MAVKSHTTCTDCSEIITQGYTDNIECPEEHKSRVLQVESILKDGCYFLEMRKHDGDSFFETCDCCGAKGAQYTNYSQHLMG